MIEFQFAVPEKSGWAYFGADLLSSGFLLHFGIGGYEEEIRFGNYNPRFRHSNSPPCLTNSYSFNHSEIGMQGIREKLSMAHCIVWTGAGISRSAGIWTDRELRKALYLHDIDRLTNFAYSQPKVLSQAFHKFVIQLFSSKPTALHRMIALKYPRNNQVWTENIDQLHQRSGSKVLCRSEIDQHLTSHELPQIVVTLGLREDPRELIQNLYLRGVQIFAAIDEPPEYPTNGWCKCDVQGLLSEEVSFLCDS